MFSEQPYRMWFEIALRVAMIDGFTWHCLRHTFAFRLVMAGMDIRTVAELMGHKSLQMTMRYAHLARAHNAAAVAKLDTSGVGTDTKTSTALPSPEVKKVIEFQKPAENQEVTTRRALSSAG